MNSPPIGNGVNDDSSGPPPQFDPMKSPPTRHRAIDGPANNPPPVHRVIYIPGDAVAVDRFFKRMTKKSDTVTLGLFFASLGFLYFSLNNPHSGSHFAIALGLKFIVFIVTGFLYLYSCFSDPGPKFLKVQVTVLGFCVGLLVLAIFLTRHT